MKLNKTSKRQELSKKYNIQHKISAHKKKMRKLAKKIKTPGRKKKVAEIPNCIFKEEILRKIERIKEIKQKEKLDRKILSQLQLVDKFSHSGDSVSKSQSQFQVLESSESESLRVNTAESPKISSLQITNNKIFSESDVVIEVIDSRNPEFFRCVEFEELVKSMNKRIIIALNKSDLIPRNVALSWLDYYRKFCPTLLLKSGSESKNPRTCTKYKSFLDTPKHVLQQTSSLVGIMELSGLLANYSRSENDERKRILVSLFGYPNVGKSSLVNALIPENKGGHGSIATETGALPGITTVNKSIHIDKYIHVTDTPGKIFHKRSYIENVVNGVTPLDEVGDPIECIAYIIKNMEDSMDLYKYFDLETDGTIGKSDGELADDFIFRYATSTGKIKKGGVVDRECASKIFLQKWINGKIKYFTMPNNKQFKINFN